MTDTHLKTFHPGWFATVMGTAIVSVVAYANPGNNSYLLATAHTIGVGFLLLAWLAAIAVLIPFVARLVRHRDAAMADLRHPVVGAMYGTLPAAILVLASATAAIGEAVLPAGVVVAIVAVLAVIGGIISFVGSVVFTYMLFVSDQVADEAVNGGWFIPPVVSIIIPLPLMALLPHVSSSGARLLLVTGYASFGIGFFLFLLVAAVLFARLIRHSLPLAPLAPSLWIGLSPIGIGSVALLRLAVGAAWHWGDAAGMIQSGSLVAATVLWGFGLWWLAIAASLLVRYLKRGGLPFSVGWWAFTFPVGAYTLATLQLARTWNTAVLEWMAVALFIVLVGFWICVSVATVQAIRDGRAWQR